MKKRVSAESSSSHTIAGIPNNKRESTPKQPKLSPSRRTATSQNDRLIQEHSAGSETQVVRLALYQPNASEVFVAGSFNNWEPRANPLLKKPDDQWIAELKLNPGQYEYRFVVDGQWLDDPMASRYVANPFGGLNSIIEVLPAS